MSVWRMRKASRGVAAAALAACLALSVAGCSGDSDDGGGGNDSGTSEEQKGEEEGSAGGQEATSDEPIAEIKSTAGIVLSLTGVERDSGGFLTVNGELENTSDEDFLHIQDWSGREEGADKTSLMGATLVDTEGKKRYYVLRDTEKRCLCTSGISNLEAGQTLNVYMQFPAPPEETQEIEFQLPTFPPTTLPLTE